MSDKSITHVLGQVLPSMESVRPRPRLIGDADLARVSGCGHVVAFRRGRRVLLVASGAGAYLWDAGTRRVRRIDLPPHRVDTLFVFEANVVGGCLYLADTLVAGGRSVVGRYYLERLEAARKWVDHHPRAVPTGSCITSPRPCPSAHSQSEVQAAPYRITCRNAWPAAYHRELWAQRPRDAVGMVFTPILRGFADRDLCVWGGS